MTRTNVSTSLMFSRLLIVSEEAIAMREKSFLSSAGEIKVLLHHFTSGIHSRRWGKMENTQKVFHRSSGWLRSEDLNGLEVLSLRLKSRDDENMKTATENIIKLKNDSMSFSLENFIAHTSVFSADDVGERAKKRFDFFVNETARLRSVGFVIIVRTRRHYQTKTSSMKKSRGRWSRATAEHSRIFYLFLFFPHLRVLRWSILRRSERRWDVDGLHPSHKDSFFFITK